MTVSYLRHTRVSHRGMSVSVRLFLLHILGCIYLQQDATPDPRGLAVRCSQYNTVFVGLRVKYEVKSYNTMTRNFLAVHQLVIHERHFSESVEEQLE